MPPFVQIDRPRVKITLHDLERFFYTPQAMVSLPYLCRVIIQFTGYDGKISVIKGIFLRFFLIYYRYFDCLLFIQYLTGFFI